MSQLKFNPDPFSAINDFEADEKSSVGILYGIGGSFCAGYDLGEAAKGGADAIITKTDGK